ncbi:MAG: hypothetical protein AB1530_03595 [Candidatus Omnitrophota bacterium]
MNRKYLIITFAFFFFCVFPFLAFASSFSLSVVPYEGGYDLRYGKISPALGRINREVTVTVNSDIAKQYRVVQSLLEPLHTDDGYQIPQNDFRVYGIRGTNRAGTLHVEQEYAVGMGRPVIYTSAQGGESDTFTLVYGLILPPDVSAGSYRGRIAFTLEPIDSAESPVTVILNIFAEVEVASSIEVTTQTGSKRVVLQAGAKEGSSADVTITIRGGFGKQFSILQMPEGVPMGSDGSELPYEVVNFLGSSSGRGMVVSELTRLSGRQQEVYTSSPQGDADSFVLNYRLDNAQQLNAGRYNFQMKYLLGGIDFSQVRLIDSVDFEVDVPRIFDLVIKPASGGLIQFRNVKPLEPPQKSEVEIEIHSNVGKKYQMTQKVISELTDKEGHVIADKFFTIQMEDARTKGQLKIPEKTPVTRGDTVLFVSDNKGSPDAFKLVYELQLPLDYRAGDYSTRIVYSLSEI